MMLDGICAALAPHYEIAGTATDGCALVEAALRLKARPDCLGHHDAAFERHRRHTPDQDESARNQAAIRHDAF
jgi:hypothetical protein